MTEPIPPSDGRRVLTKAEFEERSLALIEDFLRAMPSFWQTEAPSSNAWDNLVEIWPHHEPGMGVWDQIQELIRDWSACSLRSQPIEDLQDYWDEWVDHDDFYYDNREEAEEHGVAPYYPPLEEMCNDIALELLGDVLNRAENQGDSRREEKDAFEAMWDEPRETLEMFAGFFEEKRATPGIEAPLQDALVQWIQVCSSIPFSWPPAAPTLSLREIGSGTLRLRLSYDGARIELWAPLPATDLFIPSSEWVNSFSMSSAGVSGVEFNEHCERIGSSGGDSTHDFVISLEPTSD